MQGDPYLLRKPQDGLLATLGSHGVDADLRIIAQGSNWDEVLSLYTQCINSIDEDKAK